MNNVRQNNKKKLSKNQLFEKIIKCNTHHTLQ